VISYNITTDREITRTVTNAYHMATDIPV